MNTRRWIFAMAALLSVSAACSNEPTAGAPQAGRLSG